VKRFKEIACNPKANVIGGSRPLMACIEENARKTREIAKGDARWGAVAGVTACDEIVIEFEYETFH
jgi:hypothetical protein